MVTQHYQQELARLKDLAVAFSKVHPALAPMLSGPTTDPDVERLLEGVAFLTALLRQKLDDEFPEIVHEFMQLIWPHYLRPIPSTTIAAFKPKPALKQPFTIPAGIQLASVPIEGTPCLFQTCYEMEIHPLTLLEASLVQPPGQPAAITLLLELQGLKLSDWQPRSLGFVLGEDYATASDLYLLLRRHLSRVVMRPVDQGATAALPRESLRALGFSEREALLPYPSQSFPGYRILQEYFVLPEKFLFLELLGWERWRERGDGSRFEIHFELDRLPFQPPRVRRDNFLLFATPAVNVFPHDADPVRLDHRSPRYPVRPAGAGSGRYQIYSVEQVVGFVQGTAEERAYVPFDVYDPQAQANPVYHAVLETSPIEAGYTVSLAVAYPPAAGPPTPETLSIRLRCTNGSLPESLQLGDLSQPTSSSPEFVEFRNIRPPTPYVLPPLGTNLLWRLVAHLSLNYLSLARAENLRALLELYIPSESRDRTAIIASRKRVAGVDEVQARSTDRLVSGIMMRGQEVTMRLRQDHFASQGDLYLFGCVLDHFLGNYASMNTFTRLIIKEAMKGDIYQWPDRIGDRPLI
jgi:type VI secretion system protein ImpG